MSVSTTVYSQCGLRLRSELDLDLPTVPGSRWDVDVRWGPHLDECGGAPLGHVIAAYESADTTWYWATATGSGFRLRFRNCGEFIISADLSEVVVRRDPSGHPALLPILLAGTVSALLLTLRGETVLHASAVAIDGMAVAFVGQSGRGKSTVAALMCLDGAELVADDVLTVTVDPIARCRGGSSELRLRAAAAEIARWRPGTPTRTTADQRVALSLPAAPRKSLPLGAVVIPRPSRTASEIAISRLAPSAALFTLLAFPRVHGWRRTDVLQRDFSVLGRLANLVPVYDVTIPWGPPFSQSVAGALSTLASNPPSVTALPVQKEMPQLPGTPETAPRRRR